MKKVIERFRRKCVVCAKPLKVISYSDGTYGGGNYFGKMPLVSKKEQERVEKLGTKPYKFGDLTLRVYKEDPKSYREIEYWECLDCSKKGDQTMIAGPKAIASLIDIVKKRLEKKKPK